MLRWNRIPAFVAGAYLTISCTNALANPTPLPLRHGPASGLGGTIDPNATYLPIDMTASPFSFAGRLEVTDPNDPNPATNKHYCTAEFVDPNIIMTAAHCVYQLGVLHPDYQLTSFRGGAFSIANCPPQFPEEWGKANLEMFVRVRYDYAFARIKPALTVVAGHPIPTLHFSEIPENPPHQQSILLGYPKAVTGGTAMSALSSTYSLDVLHPRLYALSSNQTDFTEGISGGAWVNPANQFVSVNSSVSEGKIGAMSYITIYGPVFNSDFYDKAKDALLNQCPTP